MLNQEREAGIGNGCEPIKKCLYSVVFQIWPVESALRYDLWAPMSQLWANYEPIKDSPGPMTTPLNSAHVVYARE